MAELPGTPAQDDGSADPRLAGARGRAELLAALADARVFAGIGAAATSEELTDHGLRAESTAELAVLLLEVDGERALPVFPSVTALRRWRLDARPVPLLGAQACQAALDEGAAAVVVDPGGAAVVLHLDDVRALADGWVPVPGSRLVTRRGDLALGVPAVPVPASLVTALRTALVGEGLRAARLLEGPDGLVLGVTARRSLPPVELAALAQRVMTRLGDDLPADGLGLAEVPARGPGVRLVRRGLRRLR